MSAVASSPRNRVRTSLQPLQPGCLPCRPSRPVRRSRGRRAGRERLPAAAHAPTAPTPTAATSWPARAAVRRSRSAPGHCAPLRPAAGDGVRAGRDHFAAPSPDRPGPAADRRQTRRALRRAGRPGVPVRTAVRSSCICSRRVGDILQRAQRGRHLLVLHLGQGVGLELRAIELRHRLGQVVQAAREGLPLLLSRLLAGEQARQMLIERLADSRIGQVAQQRLDLAATGLGFCQYIVQAGLQTIHLVGQSYPIPLREAAGKPAKRCYCLGS